MEEKGDDVSASASRSSPESDEAAGSDLAPFGHDSFAAWQQIGHESVASTASASMRAMRSASVSVASCCLRCGTSAQYSIAEYEDGFGVLVAEGSSTVARSFAWPVVASRPP